MLQYFQVHTQPYITYVVVTYCVIFSSDPKESHDHILKCIMRVPDRLLTHIQSNRRVGAPLLLQCRLLWRLGGWGSHPSGKCQEGPKLVGLYYVGLPLSLGFQATDTEGSNINQLRNSLHLRAKNVPYFSAEILLRRSKSTWVWKRTPQFGWSPRYLRITMDALPPSPLPRSFRSPSILEHSISSSRNESRMGAAGYSRWTPKNIKHIFSLIEWLGKRRTSTLYLHCTYRMNLGSHTFQQMSKGTNSSLTASPSWHIVNDGDAVHVWSTRRRSSSKESYRWLQKEQAKGLW